MTRAAAETGRWTAANREHAGLDSRLLRARLRATVGTAGPVRSCAARSRRPLEPAPAFTGFSRHRHRLWPWAACARPCGTWGRGRRPRLRCRALESRATARGRTVALRSGGFAGTCGGCRFDPECAGAAIVMDAFGFFDTEEEHEAVLREAARVLTTGGRLALKVVNGGPVLDAFRETDREERDGVVVSVASTLTFDPPRMTRANQRQRKSRPGRVPRDASACTEPRSCVPRSNTPGSPSSACSQVRTGRHSNPRCLRRCGSSVSECGA